MSNTSERVKRSEGFDVVDGDRDQVEQSGRVLELPPEGDLLGLEAMFVDHFGVAEVHSRNDMLEANWAFPEDKSAVILAF